LTLVIALETSSRISQFIAVPHMLQIAWLVHGYFLISNVSMLLSLPPQGDALLCWDRWNFNELAHRPVSACWTALIFLYRRSRCHRLFRVFFGSRRQMPK
jgi:hypothetical protein